MLRGAALTLVAVLHAQLSAPRTEELALVVLTPSKVPTKVSVSEAIAELTKLLTERTVLRVGVAPQEVVSGCRGDPGCMASRSGGRPLLIVRMLAQLEESDEIVAALLTSEGEMLVQVAPRRAADRGSTLTLFARMVDDALRPGLETLGVWGTLGAVELEGLPENTIVALDGAELGVTGAGPQTIVEGVTLGRHVLRFEHTEHQPTEAEVEVTAGQPAMLRPELRALAEQEATPLAQATLWSGVAVGAAGVLLTITAIVRGATYGTRQCVRATPGLDCPGGRFLTAEQAFGSRSGFDDRGRLLLAPFGVSLLAAGATWSAGAAYFAESDDALWWWIGVGALAALTAYAAGAGIDAL